MKQKRILITSLVAAATLCIPSAAFAATALDGNAAAWDYAFESTDYKNVANIADACALISGAPDYFVNGDVAGSDGALRIGAETASGEGVSGVVITNANEGTGTQTFAADLTGKGVFAVYFGSTDGTTYDFQGDVSGFSGDFYVNVLESGRSNTLQFSHVGSSALSGTGALETNRALSYAVAFGAATIANASISAATPTSPGTRPTRSIPTFPSRERFPSLPARRRRSTGAFPRRAASPSLPARRRISARSPAGKSTRTPAFPARERSKSFRRRRVTARRCFSQMIFPARWITREKSI